MEYLHSFQLPSPQITIIISNYTVEKPGTHHLNQVIKGTFPVMGQIKVLHN